MGLARDDYTKFREECEKEKIFKADPFAVIDQEGVGKLSKWPSIRAARGARTSKSASAASSVQFCYRIGMDYVSCSPYRRDRASGSGSGRWFRRQIRRVAHSLTPAILTSVLLPRWRTAHPWRAFVL
jgi:hypothetical protein